MYILALARSMILEDYAGLKPKVSLHTCRPTAIFNSKDYTLYKETLLSGMFATLLGALGIFSCTYARTVAVCIATHFDLLVARCIWRGNIEDYIMHTTAFDTRGIFCCWAIR